MRTKGSVGKKTADRILTVAQSQIARLGYAAVSMRMIANEVGINVSAIYNHFPNKQQILITLMNDHMRELINAWREEDDATLSPSLRLDRFARFHIRFNTDRKDAVFISFMELRSLEEDGHRLVEKLRKNYEEALRRIIREGMAQGDFKTEDAHVAAMSILGSLTGVNTWFRASGRLSKKRIEDYYAALTLRAVGYQEVPAHV